MRNFFCVVIVFVLFAAILKAAEYPRFIALRGHSYDNDVLHYVNSIAFSPDGTKVVTVGADNTVRIWCLIILDGKVNSGIELRKLETSATSSSSVTFSSDGKKIAMISPMPGRVADVKIWDVESGKEVQKLAGKALYDTFPQISKKILTGSPTVRIWDVESGKEMQKFVGHTKRISFNNLSPDGKNVVTIGDDRTIRIWDANSGKEIRRLGEYEHMVEFVAFSPNGKKMVAAGYGSISILNTESGMVQSLKIPDPRSFLSSLNPDMLPPTFEINSITFSPDGKKIALVGTYGLAGIWALE